MAYRSCSNSARHGAPPPCRGQALSRTTFIAGATLSSLVLVSAGAVLFGNGGGLGHPSPYAGGHNGPEVALVDPVAPAVAKRDPRVAILTPEALLAVATRTTVRDKTPQHRYEVASAGPDGGFDEAPAAPTARRVPTPLPMARPAQQAIEAALVPLPRERTTHQVLAYADSADTLTTGSLGNRDLETSNAEARKIVLPVARAPVVAKLPVRPLTPHEKLYGAAGAPTLRLASLTPDSMLHESLRDPGQLPHAPYDNRTAVYVISARKVYMPDGRVLEAHSGLGDKIDDPRFVRMRMRGATPPHVYDLTARESLFHGVEAIRMTPLGGERAIFGRDGILAHTYMLGPNGQSNGCVSFRNYEAFLDAFKAGKIDRLAVLATLD